MTEKRKAASPPEIVSTATGPAANYFVCPSAAVVVLFEHERGSIEKAWQTVRAWADEVAAREARGRGATLMQRPPIAIFRHPLHGTAHESGGSDGWPYPGGAPPAWLMDLPIVGRVHEPGVERRVS